MKHFTNISSKVIGRFHECHVRELLNWYLKIDELPPIFVQNGEII